jgi:hypothetical protein
VLELVLQPVEHEVEPDLECADLAVRAVPAVVLREEREPVL